MESGIFTVIDIGTEAIRTIIAEGRGEELPLVLGAGDVSTNHGDGRDAPVNNMRKGSLRNVSAVSTRLRMAVDQAELKAKHKVEEGSVYLCLTGDIHTLQAKLERKITNADGLVSANDISELNALSRECAEFTANVNENCLQTYTSFYELEDGTKVGSAIGLPTGSLTATVHGVMYPKRGKANAIRQLVVDTLHVEPIMLYMPMHMAYVLGLCDENRRNELETGVLTIDIGAGVTSFSVYFGGCILHTGHLPVGCNHIENDLMLAFGIEWRTARRLVRRLGSEVDSCISGADDGRARMVTVENMGGYRQRRIPVSGVEKVICLRMEEIFRLVRSELKAANAWRHIGCRVYLSGGGALIPGAADVATSVFEKVAVVVKPPAEIAEGLADGMIYNDARDIVPLGALLTAALGAVGPGQSGEENKPTLLREIGRVFKAVFNW